MSKYILMHKNVAAAVLGIDDRTADITEIYGVMGKDHLPLGTVASIKGLENISRSTLNHWWRGRAIPASRFGLADALRELNIESANMLLTHSFGLSLSDQYWIKPERSDLHWKDINFFENPFSEDIGDILLGRPKKESIDMVSPDNTTDGNLQKRWKIIDGKRCLIKAGEDPYHQQPFNEVIASRIMDRLGIPHASCSLMWQDGNPYSVCECITTPDKELVSAWSVMQTRPKANHENEYLQYLNICKELGVADIQHSLDMMIVLDYLIANEDRHFRNFGLIRNPETLQFLCAAPLFDNGTSLWYNKPPHRIYSGDIPCKPFKEEHIKQLHLVTSFDWISFDKLRGIEDEIADIMSGEQAEAVLGETRYKDIAAFISNRIDAVERAALGHGTNITMKSPKPSVPRD